LYKTQISKISNEVWEKYKETGNVQLRNKILTEYLDIVVVNARRMSSVYKNKAELDDIVNQGVIALMDCIERFDWTRGVQFDSFASIRVRGSIIDYMRKHDWVPRDIRRKATEISNAYSELYIKLNREPTDADVAEYLGLSIDKFNDIAMQSSNFNLLSYEDLLQDNIEPLYDFNSTIELPEQKLVQEELKKVMAMSIDKLNEKERLIVSLYYYEELKFKEIAVILGITASRVSQLHSKALMKMKKSVEDYIKN
jgi:RNA polymerase sigma factor for flagellar operon FliA